MWVIKMLMIPVVMVGLVLVLGPLVPVMGDALDEIGGKRIVSPERLQWKVILIGVVLMAIGGIVLGLVG